MTFIHTKKIYLPFPLQVAHLQFINTYSSFVFKIFLLCFYVCVLHYKFKKFLKISLIQ